MSVEGKVTATDNAGSATAAEPNAGAKYTDDDLAKARLSFERQAEKKASKVAEAAKAEALQSVLSQLGLQSADELPEFVERVQQTAGAEDKAKGHERQLKRLQTEKDALQAEIGKLRTGIQRGAVERSVLSLAEKHNGHAKSVLAHVALENRLRADDEGRVFVVGEDGDEDHRVSADEYVKKILEDNKHLLKSVSTSGAGSRPNNQQQVSSQRPLSLRDQIAQGIRDTGSLAALTGRRR